jgi:tryptophan synthase alpha chain
VAELKTRRGLAAIDAVFAQCKSEGRAAFIPYYPVGYPDYETSVVVLKKLAEAGADIIEVGVPFSDPLADGPTIQAATQIALENGTTPQHCIDAIRELREQGIETPMVLMGYANPFMAYGYAGLIAAAEDVGIDGFIIPDMPADEVSEFQPLVETADLGIIHFMAPTSSPERIELSARMSRGYIYLVSVTGVTGERTAVNAKLQAHINTIRAVTDKPIAVGFGISTPEHAANIGSMADGIIVGSALVRAGKESPDAVHTLARRLRDAL